MPDCSLDESRQLTKTTFRSEYDTEALAERVHQWREEARAAATEQMRAFCLMEARKYELRLRQSFSTPVIG
jgi:hypothetical protein